MSATTWSAPDAQRSPARHHPPPHGPVLAAAVPVPGGVRARRWTRVSNVRKNGRPFFLSPNTRDTTAWSSPPGSARRCQQDPPGSPLPLPRSPSWRMSPMGAQPLRHGAEAIAQPLFDLGSHSGVKWCYSHGPAARQTAVETVGDPHATQVLVVREDLASHTDESIGDTDLPARPSTVVRRQCDHPNVVVFVDPMCRDTVRGQLAVEEVRETRLTDFRCRAGEQDKTMVRCDMVRRCVRRHACR